MDTYGPYEGRQDRTGIPYGLISGRTRPPASLKPGTIRSVRVVLPAVGGPRTRSRRPTARLAALVEQDVFIGRPEGRDSRGGVGAGIVVKAIWTSVRGAGVKGVSPAERGRSVATPLNAGEHTPTLSGPTMPAAAALS